MTHHPTDPGLVAHGGGETAETDILDRVRHRRDHGSFDNLHAELLAEVERLRGALGRIVSQWKAIVEVESGGGYGAALEDNIDAIEAVLRGDQ